MTDINKISQDRIRPNSGPFLAKVVSYLDPDFMGSLEVEILRPVGNNTFQGQLHKVRMISPFWGQTSASYLGAGNSYADTQKAYGMWFVPPDVGTIVIVYFIDGDPKRGYWFGCVPDEKMNFSVPGIAATEYSIDGDRVPVGEYNKKSTPPESLTLPATKLKKPRHPLADILETQGLLKDDIRGITTSSARREVPSSVFGISTPGPIDKDGPVGAIGKRTSQIDAAPISRLGGSTFVMDDGDDKLIRKKPASEGPPEYASVVDGESGDKKILHNELIRLRTRTGHQILLHSSEDLIYIGNSKGTTWIELTSDGKIDIFAEDSISIHSKNDFNFYADRDINIEAGRNVNIKGAERFQAEFGKDFNLIVKENGKISFDGDYNFTSKGKTNITAEDDINIKSDKKIAMESGTDSSIKAGANFNLTATANYNLKGAAEYRNAGAYFSIPGAGGTSVVSAMAVAAQVADLPEELPTIENLIAVSDSGSTTLKSIMARIPSKEPWPGHENLDPVNLKPDKTDRETAEAGKKPEMFGKYTAKVDTFKQQKGSKK